mmetsp:Transcript_14411/g.47329  ORF Transcript_14411/g.47329 Transcript_14411/m.47329 type:complete len:177 (-) Transcript_14411:75-605(-)
MLMTALVASILATGAAAASLPCVGQPPVLVAGQQLSGTGALRESTPGTGDGDLDGPPDVQPQVLTFTSPAGAFFNIVVEGLDTTYICYAHPVAAEAPSHVPKKKGRGGRGAPAPVPSLSAPATCTITGSDTNNVVGTVVAVLGVDPLLCGVTSAVFKESFQLPDQDIEGLFVSTVS